MKCSCSLSALEGGRSRYGAREAVDVDRITAVVVTLVVGGLVATQAPANASLARHVGALGATVVSLIISIAIVGLLLVASGELGALKGLGGFRPEHVLGGIAGAAIVYVSLLTVRSLGAGGVAAALVCSQLLVAALLDWFGVLGLDRAPLSFSRIAGMALLIAGTLLVTSS
jgi:transporter family-2 protein